MTSLARKPVAADQAHAGVNTKAMPDILYIMGTGRSGTTILEVLLANNRGFTGAGEIRHIFRDGFLRDALCACGASGRRCALWSAVLETTGWKHDDWVAGAQTLDAFESHARFPLVWAGVMQGAGVSRYRQISEAIFKTVAVVQKSNVVVDSSKYPGRALMLARLFPERVKVLCMTRSGAGILQAFEKRNEGEQRSKSPFAAAIYYLYVLCCMRLVRFRLRERCLTIRFEDLRRDPDATLHAIEHWSGYSLADARARLAAGDLFAVGHIVTGNRLRKQGRVRFASTPEEIRSSRARFAVRLLAPLLDSYRKLLGF